MHGIILPVNKSYCVMKLEFSYVMLELSFKMKRSQVLQDSGTAISIYWVEKRESKLPFSDCTFWK